MRISQKVVSIASPLTTADLLFFVVNDLAPKITSQSPTAMNTIIEGARTIHLFVQADYKTVMLPVVRPQSLLAARSLQTIVL